MSLATTKKRTTFSLDSDVLRATRVFAARRDKRDSEVVEEALRSYLGLDLLERVWERSDLTAEQAEDLAYRELHSMRKSR